MEKNNLHTENSNLLTSQENNDKYDYINIQADGDCLYGSVFIGYMLYEIESYDQFNVSLKNLIGSTICGTENFYNNFKNNYKKTSFLKSNELSSYVNHFKKHMGFDNKWGGGK